MSTNKPCLCCLVRNSDKSLNGRNTWLGNIEVYGEMLKECFEIAIEHEEDSGICTICVIRLRDALEFKNQILQCQQDLHKSISIANVKDEVKSEGSIEALEEEFFDDYLPEFGSDAEAGQGNEDSTEDKDDIKPSIKKQLPSQSTPKTKTVTKPVLKAKTKIEAKKSGVKKVDAEKVLKDIKGRKDLVVKKTIKGESTTHAETTSIETTSIETTSIETTSIETTSIETTSIASSVSQTDKCRMAKYNFCTLVRCSNCTPFMSKSAKGFNCAFCHEAYLEPESLRQHTHEMHRLRNSLRMNYTRRSYKIDITELTCNICNENIPDMKSLAQHVQQSHNQLYYPDIPLDIIEFKLSSLTGFNCAFCASTFDTFHMLLQHMSVHYNNYKCDICGKGFGCKISLKVHKTSHETGSFACEICTKVFPTKWKKVYHIKHSHKRETRHLRCPHCEQTFNYYYLRNQHILTDHNIKTPYFCNICNQGFVLKSKLTQHNKTVHLRELNHVCLKCGQAFLSSKCLRKHMAIHTKEMKYECDVCNKSYGRKFTLREHMRTHTDDRRFICHICKLGFVQKCTMKVHLLTQHGVKWVSASSTTAILECEHETYTMPIDHIIMPKATSPIQQIIGEGDADKSLTEINTIQGINNTSGSNS